MCVQTIFTMIDHLTTWADSKAKAAAVRRVKGAPQKGKTLEWLRYVHDSVIIDFYKGNPEEIKCVTSFLEGIPKVLCIVWDRRYHIPLQ